DLEHFIRADLLADLGRATGAEARRVSAFIDIALRKRPNYPQKPVEFFYPGQPAIEFWERDEFPWIERVEAMTGAIRQELSIALTEDAEKFVPYIDYPETAPMDQWRELNHSLRWSAFHLLDH